MKFLERARTEALYSIGYSNKKVKNDFDSLIIVKSCNIEYKKPAYLENDLTVRSFVKSITKTSFFMNQIVTRDDDIIAEAKVHLVFVNTNGKPVKIPDEIYSKFKPYFYDTIKTASFLAFLNNLIIILLEINFVLTFLGLG